MDGGEDARATTSAPRRPPQPPRRHARIAVRLSHEKVVHLSHVLLDRLKAAGPAVKLVEQPNAVRLRMVESMNAFLRREEACAERARQKIRSQTRRIPEGSAEFDALFRQFYAEEMSKLRKVK